MSHHFDVGPRFDLMTVKCKYFCNVVMIRLHILTERRIYVQSLRHCTLQLNVLNRYTCNFMKVDYVENRFSNS